jgi:hypothetical protein
LPLKVFLELVISVEFYSSKEKAHDQKMKLMPWKKVRKAKKEERANH